VLDISVGGVEERVAWKLEVRLGEDLGVVNGSDAIAGRASCAASMIGMQYHTYYASSSSPAEFTLQFAQKYDTCVLPLGDRIRGTVQPGVGHELSVKT
jgi:hypothetical protein